jgi:hypothetical protein
MASNHFNSATTNLHELPVTFIAYDVFFLILKKMLDGNITNPFFFA